MTTEDAWRLAAAIEPRPFDADALALVFRRLGPDPVRLIRGGLKALGDTSWGMGLAGLQSLFGTGDAQHCFHVAPILWGHFHEPQITAGFAHFLNEGGSRQRAARALAFARAAAHSADSRSTLFDFDTPDAVYCVAEERRVDLLVEFRFAGEKFGVAVEAKFGHHLTTGQLPHAKRHAVSRNWTLDRSVFLVVAPDTEQLNPRILSSNPLWRAVSWWGFLSQLERRIDPADDNAAFRSFRRTVWHRAY